MTLRWENLKENKCPYCGDPLEQKRSFVNCTWCRFRMELWRFKKIQRTRGNPDEPHPDMKWQNLHRNGCPICGETLIPDELGMHCETSRCTFRPISDAKVRMILNNPTHPANLLKKQNDNENN